MKEIHSAPYAKFTPIQIGDCKWTSGFWAEKLKVCEDKMLPYMEELLCGDVGHGLNNFKIAAGLQQGEHRGMYWHDGDFYKWMEAAVYIYAQNGDQKILDKLDEYISIIGQAQLEDGYLQTQIQLSDQAERYENRKYHEMYNTGHLLISACVHHRVTGKRNFLDIAIKHADLLCTIFYPETKQYGRFGFNQTQIMGLVELYRLTKEMKYLKLAEKFINRRGKYTVVHHPTTEGYPIGDMVQERTPLRESKEAVGHAVLALYFYAGATDVYAETGETALIRALERLWESIAQKKMYITGAVGQTHYGASSNRDKIEEGFIDDFMMPNLTAYNETCANLCNAMFNFRMLTTKGESKFADIIELVMFNSGLSGISLAGTEYFYANPLRMIHGSRNYKQHENDTETPEREPYLDCFCCPPNLVRTLAKLSHWAYSNTENGIAINLYGSNELNTQLRDGSKIHMVQESNYPWDGKITITLKECKDKEFEIYLRIPEWAGDADLRINGKLFDLDLNPGQYVKVTRIWTAGDVLKLVLTMQAELVEGNGRIEETRNQVAVQRGPVVYCIESTDLPKDTSIVDVYIPFNADLKAEYKADLLDGIVVIHSDLLLRKVEKNGLYRKVGNPEWKNYRGLLVPYFAWSNRGLAEMTVFMPIIWNPLNQAFDEIT